MMRKVVNSDWGLDHDALMRIGGEGNFAALQATAGKPAR